MKIKAAVVREKSAPFTIEKLDLDNPRKTKFWSAWWAAVSATQTWWHRPDSCRHRSRLSLVTRDRV